jgi:hypothetical protein
LNFENSSALSVPLASLSAVANQGLKLLVSSGSNEKGPVLQAKEMMGDLDRQSGGVDARTLPVNLTGARTSLREIREVEFGAVCTSIRCRNQSFPIFRVALFRPGGRPNIGILDSFVSHPFELPSIFMMGFLTFVPFSFFVPIFAGAGLSETRLYEKPAPTGGMLESLFFDSLDV